MKGLYEKENRTMTKHICKIKHIKISSPWLKKKNKQQT